MVASISRAGLAIAALSIAVAMSLGVGMMIESFRENVAEWLDQILQADLYITAPSTAARHSPPCRIAFGSNWARSRAWAAPARPGGCS